MQDINPRGQTTADLAESFGLSRTASGLFEGGPAGRAVYDALRERIVSLDLPPGTALLRSDLARAYGVSLTPLRDALQQLAEEGLVRIFPQSRTLVTPIDVTDVGDAQFLRLALESEVVRRIATGISDADLGRLKSIHALQASIADRPAEIQMFQDLDELFHQALFAAAGHVRAQRLMRSRAGHLERLRRLHLPDAPAETGSNAVITGHGAILDGITAGDPDRAVTALRAHLQRTVDRITEKRAAFPEYFSAP